MLSSVSGCLTSVTGGDSVIIPPSERPSESQNRSTRHHCLLTPLAAGLSTIDAAHNKGLAPGGLKILVSERRRQREALLTSVQTRRSGTTRTDEVYQGSWAGPLRWGCAHA